MKHFFISYNKADRDWAEWVAWQLEEAGYDTLIQAWDFRPGTNFVLEMERAATQAERVVAILSPDYVNSGFTKPEWASAFAQDPTGERHLLIPVRIKEFKTHGGLLAQLVYIDLVDSDEMAARDALLKGVAKGRAKPTNEPHFPGSLRHTVPKPDQFPGAAEPSKPPTPSQNEGGRFTKRNGHTVQPLSSYPYVVVSAVGLLIVLLCLVAYVYFVPRLVSSDFEGRVYYFSLVLLGLVCAAFLFGAMKSYAWYSGKQLSGRIKLSGTVGAAVLVVIGGIFLTSSASLTRSDSTFDITVKVSGRNGERIESGTVTALLGRDAWTGRIHGYGEADLKNVPARLKNTPAKILVTVPGFKAAEQDIPLLSELVVIQVERDTFSITVRLINQRGERLPEGQVTLFLGAETREATVSSSGEARLTDVPSAYRGSKAKVRFTSPGYRTEEPQLTLHENLIATLRPDTKQPRSTSSRTTGLTDEERRRLRELSSAPTPTP